MRNVSELLRIYCGVVALCSFQAWAEQDSTQLLFADSSVRAYTLNFYVSDWKAQLESNWATDSGYMPAQFSDGTITLDSIGVRYKGNSSYSGVGNSPKKPFKLKFDAYRSEQNYYGVSVLNFSNGYGDPTFLREKLAYDISRKYLPTPRASFATISVGTDLVGLYTQVEQADKLFLARWYARDSFNLFKASDNGASMLYKGQAPSLYADQFELKTNTSTGSWSGLVYFINAINNQTDEEFCADYSTFVDMDNVTKFLAFNMVLSHFDSYTGSGRNMYLYQQFGGVQMSFIPWDMNLAFGGYSNGWNVYTQSALTTSNQASRPLLQRIKGCPALRNQYLAWIREMVHGAASTDSVQANMERLAPLIRPYVVADPNKFYRIGAFDTNQTSKYRASSSELIPGLLEFSTARNAKLLQEVADSLAVGYVLPVMTAQTSLTLTVHKVQGGWMLQGVGSLGNYRVECLAINGKSLGTRSYSGAEGARLLALPQGLVLLRVSSGSMQKVFTIQNY